VNAKYLVLWVLLIGFCTPLKAQLSESFRVNSSPSKQANIEASSNQAISCNAADLLMALGCYREAADMYSTLIDQFKLQNDTVNLDRACTGLYRAQLLSNSSAKYTESLAKCRPEIIDPLMGEVDWEPMFITVPAFEPDVSWLNSATPGAIYKVTVQFDIDEYGNPDNFDFNADDKMYLKYPVIDDLKKARYLPAVKNGKAVKKTKNIVEVTFCLDRGSSCGNEN
jgi:hypothetical protein